MHLLSCTAWSPWKCYKVFWLVTRELLCSSCAVPGLFC